MATEKNGTDDGDIRDSDEDISQIKPGFHVHQSGTKYKGLTLALIISGNTDTHVNRE